MADSSKKTGLFGNGWEAFKRAEAAKLRALQLRQQARAAASGFTDEVTMGLADPVLAVGDATFHPGQGGWVDRFQAETARKQAQDLSDAKNYGVARNIGRVAGVAAGVIGPAAPALARVGGRAIVAARGPAAVAAARAKSIAKYVAEGATPEQAARLAEPYRGLGHHSVVSRAVARKDPTLRAFSETPFSRISGRSMETGEFYKFHYRNDPSFSGTWFGRSVPGVWKGAEVPGLTRNGQLARLWEGTPLATKASLFGGAPASAGLFQALEEERLPKERGR